MTTTNFAAPVKKQKKVSKNYLEMVTLAYQNKQHEKRVSDYFQGNSENRMIICRLPEQNKSEKGIDIMDGCYNVGWIL